MGATGGRDAFLQRITNWSERFHSVESHLNVRQLQPHCETVHTTFTTFHKLDYRDRTFTAITHNSNFSNTTTTSFNMSNEVQDPNSTEQMSDTPMESPEKLDKGKGKSATMQQDPMEEDEDESEEDEEVSCPKSTRNSNKY